MPDNIQEAILDMASSDYAPVLVGTVTKVDGENITVEPLNEEAEITDVRLVASDTQTGFIIYPDKGSEVIVLMLDEEAGLLCQASSIEKIEFRKAENESGLLKLPIFLEKLNQFINLVKAHTHGTAVGPTTTAINAFQMLPIQQRDVENEYFKH